jgi:hypothetical protein
VIRSPVHTQHLAAILARIDQRREAIHA